MKFYQVLARIDGNYAKRKSWPIERCITTSPSHMRMMVATPIKWREPLPPGEPIPPAHVYTFSYAPHLVLLKSNMEAEPWLPSHEDFLADDWMYALDIEEVIQ